MNEILGGIKQVFWNPEEKRLRALFRVPVAFAVGLLCASLVVGLSRFVAGGLGLSETVRTLMTQFAGVVVVLALTWFIDRRHFRDFGVALDRQWGRDLLAGGVAGIVMVLTVVVVVLGTGFATMSPNGVSGGAVVAFGQAILFFVGVAVLEETILRGYLLVNIAEGLTGYTGDPRRATLLAVAVTAALFGLGHAGSEQPLFVLVNLSAAGLLLGAAYVVTDRLAFPIGLHFAWNFTLGPVFGFRVSGQTQDTSLVSTATDGPVLVTGGEFGPESSLLMLVALAVGAGVLALWTRHEYGTLAVNERIAIPDLWVTDDGDS